MSGRRLLYYIIVSPKLLISQLHTSITAQKFRKKIV